MQAEAYQIHRTRFATLPDRSLLGIAHRAEELQDFFRTQDHRQFLRFLCSWDHLLEGPILLERDSIEKTQCRNRDENGTGR